MFLIPGVNIKVQKTVMWCFLFLLFQKFHEHLYKILFIFIWLTTILKNFILIEKNVMKLLRSNVGRKVCVKM